MWFVNFSSAVLAVNGKKFDMAEVKFKKTIEVSELQRKLLL